MMDKNEMSKNDWKLIIGGGGGGGGGGGTIIRESRVIDTKSICITKKGVSA